MYVPVVILAKENYINLLEQLKSGLKRTLKWNKYRSQMTIQPQNNNLYYLIDPKFMNVNRLFVLSFPRNNNIDSIYFFSNYYVPKVEIKDFHVLDNIFVLWEHDEDKLKLLVQKINKVHPTIRFRAEWSKMSLSRLSI